MSLKKSIITSIGLLSLVLFSPANFLEAHDHRDAYVDYHGHDWGHHYYEHDGWHHPHYYNYNYYAAPYPYGYYNPYPAPYYYAPAPNGLYINVP